MKRTRQSDRKSQTNTVLSPTCLQALCEQVPRIFFVKTVNFEKHDFAKFSSKFLVHFLRKNFEVICTGQRV